MPHVYKGRQKNESNHVIVWDKMSQNVFGLSLPFPGTIFSPTAAFLKNDVWGKSNLNITLAIQAGCPSKLTT